MEFMTRELWDALILGVIAIGLLFAFLRLRADLTRPMDDDNQQGED
ncbi:MAG: hypothetical protein SH821_11830 [Phototrophicales bacterium]|nr:hypothetical protein [Phototrophicales bacterium]